MKLLFVLTLILLVSSVLGALECENKDNYLQVCFESGKFDRVIGHDSHKTTSLQFQLYIGNRFYTYVTWGLTTEFHLYNQWSWSDNEMDLLMADVFDTGTCRILPNTFVSLNSLQELEMTGDCIGKIKAGAFHGLFGLEKLSLIYIQSKKYLLELSYGVFVDLPKLTHLAVTRTNIEHLSDGVFDGLPSLEYLDLGNNKLKVMPAMNLSSLVELNLYGNQITHLPGKSGINLPSLRFLLLLRNPLKSVPDGIFDPLTSLEYLDLSSTSLEKIPAINLPSLTTLRLSQNPVRSVPDGIFDHLTSLESLQLDYLEIESISGKVFDNLKSLKILNLSGNKLKTIPVINLRSLESLRLYGNEIEELDTGALSQLSNLQRLILGKNNIRTIKTDAFKGRTFNVLDLGQSAMHEIAPRAFNNLTTRTLFLSLYNDTKIDVDAFAGLTVQNLDLCSFRRCEVPKGAFKNTTVGKIAMAPILENGTLSKAELGLPESTELITDVEGMKQVHSWD